MKKTDPRHVLSERVKQAGSQKQVADDLGISQAYMSDLLLGRRTFSAGILAKLGLQTIIVTKAS